MSSTVALSQPNYAVSQKYSFYEFVNQKMPDLVPKGALLRISFWPSLGEHYLVVSRFLADPSPSVVNTSLKWKVWGLDPCDDFQLLLQQGFSFDEKVQIDACPNELSLTTVSVVANNFFQFLREQVAPLETVLPSPIVNLINQYV